MVGTGCNICERPLQGRKKPSKMQRRVVGYCCLSDFRHGLLNCGEFFGAGPDQEPIREVRPRTEGFATSRRSMMPIMALRTKAAARRQCHSKFRVRRPLRLIHRMVRSTIQRFGSTTNLCPLYADALPSTPSVYSASRPRRQRITSDSDASVSFRLGFNAA